MYFLLHSGKCLPYRQRLAMHPVTLSVAMVQASLTVQWLYLKPYFIVWLAPIALAQSSARCRVQQGQQSAAVSKGIKDKHLSDNQVSPSELTRRNGDLINLCHNKTSACRWSESKNQPFWLMRSVKSVHQQKAKPRMQCHWSTC